MSGIIRFIGACACFITVVALAVETRSDWPRSTDYSPWLDQFFKRKS